MKVLVIDDDRLLASSVDRFLSSRGFVVAKQTSCDLRLATEFGPDVILLDLVLQSESGVDFIEQVRRSDIRNAPIIVFSGRDCVRQKVACFELGADDYVTKPVKYVELEARVRAVIRRAKAGPVAYEDGHLRIDLDSRTLVVSSEQRFLSLSEWIILRELLLGKEISRGQLAQALWGGTAPVESRAIDRMIVNLRRKIEPNGQRGAYIRAIRGIGYQFLKR